MAYESERCLAQVRLCWRTDGSLDISETAEHPSRKEEIDAFVRRSGLFRRFLHYRRCFREGEQAEISHAFWSSEGWGTLAFEIKKEGGSLFASSVGETTETSSGEEKDGLFFFGDEELRLFRAGTELLPWPVGESLAQAGREEWQKLYRECLRSQTTILWEDETWKGGGVFALEPQLDAWGWSALWRLRFTPLDLKARASLLAQQSLQMKGMSYLVRGLVHDINNFLTGVMANLSMSRLLLTDEQEAVPFLEAAEDSSAKMGDSMQELAFLSWSPSELKGESSLESCLEPWAYDARALTGLSLQWSKPLVGAKVAFESNLVKDLLLWALRFFARFGGCDQAELKIQPCWRIEPNDEEKGRVFLTFVLQGEPRKPLPSIESGELFWPYIELDGRRQFSPLSRAWVTLRGLRGWMDAQYVGRTLCLSLHLPGFIGSQEVEKEAKTPIVKRVLLMDDEPMVRESVAMTLEALGYEVESADSGENALLLFQEARLAGRQFHLGLLDMNTHGGMDGLETGRQLRSLDPSLRLVLLSGYDTESNLQEHKENGFDAAMRKPFRIAALARLLEDVLRRP